MGAIDNTKQRALTALNIETEGTNKMKWKNRHLNKNYECALLKNTDGLKTYIYNMQQNFNTFLYIILYRNILAGHLMRLITPLKS